MNKKVVITGATGFIGSSLTTFFLKKNYQVYIIVRPTSNFSNIEINNKNLNIYEYNENLDKLITFFKEVNPICTFHLASNFIAEHQSAHINGLVSSNISFGLQLLEAMKEANVKTLINTGTSWQHYNNEEYNPVCLYAATKQAFENLIEYYVQAESFKVITLKLFDTYGETDKRPKLINMLYQFAMDQTELKLSLGEQMINLVHIKDVCNAYEVAMNMLENQKSNSHYKYVIRHPKSYTLKEVINIFENVSKLKINIVWGGKSYRKREVMQLWNKGESLPNWNALVSLEEGFLKNNK